MGKKELFSTPENFTLDHYIAELAGLNRVGAYEEVLSSTPPCYSHDSVGNPYPMLERGLALTMQANYAEAEMVLAAAEYNAAKTGNIPALLNAKAGLLYLFRTGDRPQKSHPFSKDIVGSRRMADEIEKILATSPEPCIEISKAFNEIGLWVQEDVGIEDAIKYYKKGLENGQTVLEQDPDNEVNKAIYNRTLQLLGVAYEKLEGYDQATGYQVKALGGFEKIGDVHNQRNAHISLGRIAGAQGNAEEARKQYEVAKQLCFNDKGEILSGAETHSIIINKALEELA
ncbi:tetratricopeptide repeat protein [Candidatus Beckwithbacteria bacterium]|nr:tetratricopeptide repeat protein [Candidatus Beckwithbacteria bacterium]